MQRTVADQCLFQAGRVKNRGSFTFWVFNAVLLRQKPLKGLYLYIQMEGDAFSVPGNGNQMDGKVLQTFQKSFGQVQNILDQNRLLINEINQNHESKIPDNLSRNVSLIRELNDNIRRVVDLYAGLSTAFTKSMETSSEGDSAGTLKSDGKPSVASSQKRLRP
ncbi:hypothetical protein SUGI_0517870 [Cryptomeria japonica]|nr:hypothetical protein SUGI_0517870 [Cryptomeria japonica]